MKNKRKPLGYIELESGVKEINVMNDIFLNYMFKNKETWEMLKSIVNIFLGEYVTVHHTKEPLPNFIEGEIEVTTQHEFFLDPDKKTRVQDIKLSHKEITFIEFQNRANTIPPINERAIEYFGLGIGHSDGKIANQIWLLAEDAKDLLYDEKFTNYMLIDNITGNLYPNNSSIMFVSLQKLSKEKTVAGELSRFLLGEELEPVKEEVRNISKEFGKLFHIFKEDKEIKAMMTVKERFKNEGREEGREEGILSVAKNLISLGLSLQQISMATGLSVEVIETLKMQD